MKNVVFFVTDSSNDNLISNRSSRMYVGCIKCEYAVPFDIMVVGLGTCL